MKITALKVNGFGVWSGLSLDELSDELNVFCGPNEAGKTTLLQFVRAVLYGFSSERMRYLPPVRGGRPGGLIELASQQGSFQVARHTDHTDKNGRVPAILTAADGSRQPEPLLNQILCNVDETVFKNVFAFGLQEIQQLGSLGDTEAAELLFSLTTGLDRVSLVEVMRELDSSRNRLLSGDGTSGQIVQLLSDRNRIKQDIEDLSSLTARYGRLATQRNHLDRDLGRLEEEKSRLRHDTRSVEIAVTLRPRWDARVDAEARLAGLRQFGTISEGAVARLERIEAAAAKHRDKIARLSDRRRRLRVETRDIEINEELCRQSARVEALHEQTNWLGTLENRTVELELETEQIRADLAAEYESLGLAGGKKSIDFNHAGDLPLLGRRKLSRLRGPMTAMRRTRQQLEDARQEVHTASEAAQSATGQITAALATREQSDLPAAIDSAGNLVAQFRRRTQLDERLGQMEQYQSDLEAQIRGLLERQVMPVWMLSSFGAVFVVGAILLIAGFFWSGSTVGGWAMSILGILSLIGGVAVKFFLERSNATRLESCQKQLSMLQLQVQEASAQRDVLDESLPVAGDQGQDRLEKSQSELAALEELMPIEARRQTALQEAEAARGRVARAEEDLSQARRRWRESLQSAGLPEKLTPKQVRLISRRCDRLEELAGRLERSREELQQRGEELKGITGRIYQLASETDVSTDGDQPARLLARLFEQLNHQQALLARRQKLRDHVRGLQRIRTKREKMIRRLGRRRRELFEQAGATDEHDFRQRADRREKAEALGLELETARAEIEAAVGEHCPQSEIAALLSNFSSEELENRWDKDTKRLEEIEGQIRASFEQRGKLAEKLKALADDRRPAEKQLELSVVKQRLKEAIRQWRVLALTSGILKNIRVAYERDRQPATLQEASSYLLRLTEGRYTRVWTPLGEDVLMVDDAAGESLPCEVLSRGTREQLFLSLRLALVSSYARRGAKLPLVLDDVLVNFDTTRAKAAAEVLADFARAGHQLLVFTCHDHIFKLFRSLKVRVSRLPDNASPGDMPPLEVGFIDDDVPEGDVPEDDVPEEESPDDDQQEAAEDDKPSKKPRKPKAAKKSKKTKGRSLKRAHAHRATAEPQDDCLQDEIESLEKITVDDKLDETLETTVFDELNENKNQTDLGSLKKLMNDEEAFEWELASDEPCDEVSDEDEEVSDESDEDEEYEYVEYEESDDEEDELSDAA